MKNMIDKACKRGIKEAEAFYLDKINEKVLFKNNKLNTVKKAQNSGIALRVVKDGKMGFTTSTNLDSIDKILDNAEDVTQYSQTKEFDFSKQTEYPNLKLNNKKIWDLPQEKLIEDGNKAVEIIKKYDDSILTSLQLTKEKQSIKIANTNGVDSFYEKDIFSIYMGAFLAEGSNFTEYAINKTSLDENYDICKLAEKTINEIKLLRQNSSFEPGKKTVIFTPSFLTQVLLTLQQGLDGSLVAKGVSPLCNKIGEKILDEKITLIDDGLMENGYSSILFDDEGTPSQKTFLIENGVLKNYLHSLKTAEKLGHIPTGNGLRNTALFSTKKIEEAPKPDITNLVMKPGDIKYEDMIASINDGVIIDNLMGILMNNLLNGDFSGNIGRGYVVKNGKITGRIKNAAINANIYDIFNKNLVGIGDTTYNTSLFSFIGSYTLPYVMLKDINIAGKK